MKLTRFNVPIFDFNITFAEVESTNDDADIDKIKATGIAKTNMYKLAGNSIVVSCLYHILRTLLVPDAPENLPKTRQLTLDL